MLARAAVLAAAVSLGCATNDVGRSDSAAVESVASAATSGPVLASIPAGDTATPMIDRLPSSTSPQDDVFRRLREQVLSVSPAEIRLAPTAARPNVWGALMEWAIDDDVAMLVTLADGTVSLYLSSGGGVIGAGAHGAVREAAGRFLDLAEASRGRLTAGTTFPLVTRGNVRFHFRTFGEELSIEIPERALVDRRHPLTPMWDAAQEVIAAIRSSTPDASAEVPAGPPPGTRMTLELAEPPDHAETVVARDPDAAVIERTVRRLKWDDITFVILRVDDATWMQVSGSLDPGDGLSASVTMEGQTWITSEAPPSLDVLIALLVSWRKGDGRWREIVDWS